ACVVLQAGFTYLPWLQRVFGSTGLDALQWGKVVLAGASVFALAELEKALWRLPAFERRRHEHPQPSSLVPAAVRGPHRRVRPARQRGPGGAAQPEGGRPARSAVAGQPAARPGRWRTR